MIKNQTHQTKDNLRKSLQVDKELIDRIKNSDNPESLFSEETDIKNISNQTTIKKGKNNKDISQADITNLDKQLKALKHNDVLNRLSRQLADEHVEEADLGVQSVYSTDTQRRKIKRGKKIVSDFMKSDNKIDFTSSNIKYSTKETFKQTGISAMESEDPTKDSGFTAVSQSLSTSRSTKDVAKIAREKIINLKRFKKIKGVSTKGTGFIASKAKTVGTAVGKGISTVAMKGKMLIASKGGLIIGGMFLLFMIIGTSLTVGLGGGAVEAEQETTFNATGLSQETLQWESKVVEELEKYGLGQYKDLILVIIEIESGGTLDDVMQSSESKGLAPNTITNPNESIEVGVAYFKEVMDEKEKYSVDMNTAIQAYNYGKHFISYVADNGSEWTQKLTNNFSKEQAEKLGWSSYGDKKYLSKILEYLTVSGDSVEFVEHDVSFDLEGQKLAFPVPNYENAITSSYGWRIHPIYKTRKFHNGTDIPAPYGTPVIAVADGIVTEAGSKGGYGNTVVIDHGSGVVTLYAHNSSLNVIAGQQVKVGQVIAKVGSTGVSTGNHSHFEVRHNGRYTDPVKWLK